MTATRLLAGYARTTDGAAATRVKVEVTAVGPDGRLTLADPAGHALLSGALRGQDGPSDDPDAQVPGYWQVPVIPTDTAGVLPAGWAYRVLISTVLSNEVLTDVIVQVPSGSGKAWLDDLAPLLTPPDVDWDGYLLQLGGGGGASTWDQLEGIPTDLETTGGSQTKADTARDQAIATATALVDALKGAAPAAYDTLVEIAAKLDADDDALAGILATLGDKVDEADLDTLIGILAATTGSDVKALLDAKATPADISTAIASEADARAAAITAAVNGLVDAAPGALDTLNELAAAMGDDPAFATTVTNALAAKVPTSRTLAGLDLTANRTAAEIVTALASALNTTYGRKDGATWTGSHDFTGASVTGIGGGSSVDTTVWLGASNGTDDTAAINAILATSSGKVVKGRPGATYLLTNPLVLPSPGNIVLDMTGCTVKLKDNQTMKNLLNNGAMTPLRTTADGAITAGTTTLTSATAAFVTADVGRWVKIAGAAVSGDLLVARITARADATTVTIDTAASTTVTAAALNVHEADHDIIVHGGTWDHARGTTSGLATPVDHSLRLRFVDRLILRNMTHTSTKGKYAVSLAGVTDYLVENQQFTAQVSDGVHIAGPATRGIIRNLQGDTGDDMVSVTAQEPSGWEGYNDCLGAVKHLAIENLEKKSGNARVLHLAPGRSAPITHVSARNLYGTTSSYGIYLWGDAAKPGGRLDNVTIENVAIDSGTDTVYINEVVSDRITLRNVTRSTNAAQRGVYVLNSTLDALTIDGFNVKITAAGSSNSLYVNNSTIGELALRRFSYSNTDTTNTTPIILGGNSGITRFILGDSVATFAGPATLIQTQFNAGQPGAAQIVLERCRISAVGGQPIKTGNNTVTAVTMTDTLISGMQWLLGDFTSTTAIYVNNLRGTGLTSGLCWCRDTSAVALSGSIDANLTGAFKSGTGTLRVRTLGIAGDASVPNNKVAGDQMTNTNAALACGVGPIAYNGTNWVHLGSGATY
jgi:hypothetical protein